MTKAQTIPYYIKGKKKAENTEEHHEVINYLF
jgi:hypothetical protein